MYSLRFRFSIFLILAVVLAACTGATPGAETPPEPSPTETPPEPATKESEPQQAVTGPEGVTLPDEIAGGTIIPWPEPSVREAIGADFREAMLNTGFGEEVAASFDFMQVATYPSPDAFEAVTAPIVADYDSADFTGGFTVGVFWDVPGRLGYGEKMVFPVTFFEDGHAELTDVEGKALVTRDLLFAGQDPSFGIESRTFFVEGSCWGCWTLDSRCGCLICW